ncbi:MAG: AMP-binding protein [Actinomycetota bacterium]
MPIPLKVVPANEVLAATIALADALSAKQAVFISPPILGDVKPELEPLPKEVDDHIALIVESSGSTGKPKRIAISRQALIHSAKMASERLGPDGQWLLALPINFIAGSQVLIRSLIANTQPIIQPSTLPFTPEAFFRFASLLTNEYKYTSLVPTQLHRLVEYVEKDASALNSIREFRAILVGGQATSPQLLKRARDMGIKVVESYGMTETAGGCVYDGIPLTGVALKIATDGRLMIQGKTLAEDQGEWLVTNDLAELEEGRLRILGRADRVLISGGLKVSLDALEHKALEVSGVADLVAVGIENQEWGERVGICYVGSPEVADDIAAKLATEIGAAGKPIRVIRVDQIPILATGKKDLLSVKKLFMRSQNED